MLFGHLAIDGGTPATGRLYVDRDVTNDGDAVALGAWSATRVDD